MNKCKSRKLRQVVVVVGQSGCGGGACRLQVFLASCSSADVTKSIIKAQLRLSLNSIDLVPAELDAGTNHSWIHPAFIPGCTTHMWNRLACPWDGINVKRSTLVCRHEGDHEEEPDLCSNADVGSLLKFSAGSFLFECLSDTFSSLCLCILHLLLTSGTS